jgi:hypothetical protein
LVPSSTSFAITISPGPQHNMDITTASRGLLPSSALGPRSSVLPQAVPHSNLCAP